MSKFEKLLDLLVNEQKDEAEKLFHEIVVEKSRGIYEGILADEEAEATEESADQDDADEVDEAAHKDKKEKITVMIHAFFVIVIHVHVIHAFTFRLDVA